MSALEPVAVVMDADEARRLTERIRYTALGVRDGVEKLQRLVAEAQEGNAHIALGYRSWTAYLADVMGAEPLVLAPDQRRDVVAWLAGEGMSVRAIEAVTDVPRSTVSRLLAGVPDGTPAHPPVVELGEMSDAELRQVAATAIPPFDPRTGEVIDAPPVPRPITGLDGKTYARRPLPDDRAPREGVRTNVVVEINKAITAAEDAAQHASRITREHLAHRTEEATVWTRRLSVALETLERLNTSLREASR